MRWHVGLTTVILVVAIVSGCGVAAAEPLSAAGTISKVTVYRGQALVTRKIDVDVPAGASELVVADLPANLLPDSIYAQTAADVKVLSVRYRQHAVMEDPRDEVRQLDSQIETVKHDIKVATEQQEHLNVQWKMFESLRDFTITAEKSDLNRGLLTFEPVGNLAGLIEKKGTDYLAKRIEFEDKLTDLQGKLSLLERQRKDLVAGQSKTEREAVVFLAGAGKRISLELSYLVSGANWQQQYNLRANPDRSTVAIEYDAVVNQTSSEDWNGVTLSLSTAEPTMVAAAPVLEPMLVGLAGRGQVSVQQPEQQMAQNQQGVSLSPADQVRQMQQQRKVNISKGIAANTELNELALTNQNFYFNSTQKEIEQFQRQMAEVVRVEGVSVTYDLPGKLTLPSRSDQQLVTIATIAAKAEFALIASPLLTDYVYLQADLVNGSDTILLPGPASIFRDGQFVGRGNMPLVTMGERFTAGFGIDSQVQVAHELEEKTTRIQGGNRIDTYTYRIALRNYKNAAVGLRLLDRLPYTEDASVRIEPDKAKTEPALSTDAEYLRTLAKKGILRWDLKLGPNTIDDKATIVRYSYTMEYDRNMQIQPRRPSARQ